MTQAVLCPVCNGRGKVPAGDNSPVEKKTCHGCYGKGWVEVSNYITHYPPWTYPYYGTTTVYYHETS